MSNARVVQVIVTRSCVGRGTKEDLARSVYELWTLDGRPIAAHDTWTHESWASEALGDLTA